ncbi:mersacidin/lichenicidin family type 2 lantibiotic [Hyalangium rubrum]|uniref:Mersacidin/lichenicidin family type 2 lantibiotic n=1 Tax=Hyalangium rubrum TaxID=3103134 RepID=A0ABU5GWD9_9BACT|nr:mersacidin/lichenicidin family type 2 lantibiotic [Hyalangium sp. s54d21]MDY7225495.1 mersacidin/lichenicidin family type 2 lantibiotic [Hyalangium sp. s54d21]
MNKERIVQAWRNPEYRASLSAEERALLPESPAGAPLTELGESELSDITGGVTPCGDTRTKGPLACTLNSCGIVACVPPSYRICVE